MNLVEALLAVMLSALIVVGSYEFYTDARYKANLESVTRAANEYAAMVTTYRDNTSLDDLFSLSYSRLRELGVIPNYFGDKSDTALQDWFGTVHVGNMQVGKAKFYYLMQYGMNKDACAWTLSKAVKEGIWDSFSLESGKKLISQADLREKGNIATACLEAKGAKDGTPVLTMLKLYEGTMADANANVVALSNVSLVTSTSKEFTASGGLEYVDWSKGVSWKNSQTVRKIDPETGERTYETITTDTTGKEFEKEWGTMIGNADGTFTYTVNTEKIEKKVQEDQEFYAGWLEDAQTNYANALASGDEQAIQDAKDWYDRVQTQIAEQPTQKTYTEEIPFTAYSKYPYSYHDGNGWVASEIGYTDKGTITVTITRNEDGTYTMTY